QSMRRFRIAAQRLNVVIFLLRKFVTGNVELQRAAERDVEDLQSFTDRKDREATRNRFLHRFKFLSVPRRIDMFVEYGKIDNFLAQKFRSDVGATSEKQTIGFVEIDRTVAGVANAD